MQNFFKSIFTIIGFLTLSSWVFGQNVTMGDVGYPESNPIPCSTFSDGSTPNFFDDAGAGNYSPSYNDTTVFCPDLNEGTKMTLTYGINAGFTFNVDGSDSIYVFDGPNTSSPLIGVHNSVTDPVGFSHTASWNNPSGCLTVVFISDATTEGSGWEANVSCGNINQPFDPHIEAFVNGTGPNALNPLDTGFVDVCFGDSILFVAKPIFPNSLETTGYGYSQNVGNVAYDWYITDGNTYPDNDSIWFTPPTRNGFLIDLKITDAFPQIERMLCKVRVSQLPIFAGTGPVEDTVCLGENTNLVGGVTPTDTVGIDIPSGSFQLGGSFAGLTYLPDGSGAQYAAPIDIGGFPSGATIANSQDLNQVCITMEHSYLGDLEIALECPNGTQVTLVNANGAGFIPGGFGGGGTYLGDADDASGNGVPGIGWEYCFSSVFNDWGDMPTEFAAGNTVATTVTPGNQSMNPNGVYLPEDDFSAFAGCPINGQWTIIVQDNLTIDDGYIFEWGLFFDPAFFPGANGYQNTVVSEDWQNHPTIVSGQNDTLLVVQPDTPGFTYYVYEITDDFGCDYDTTVALYALPQPTIFSDTIGCDLGYFVNGTQSYDGGTWSSTDTAIYFLPDANVENPAIHTSTPGVYTVTYTDDACSTPVTAEIDFPPYPFTYFTDTVLCNGVVYNLTAPNDNSYSTSFVWNDGTTGPTINIDSPGTYTVTMSNVCHTGEESVNVEYKLCDIDAPNVLSLAEGSQNSLWYVKAEGLSEFNLTITNRWGNVVYECNNSDGICYWDGRNKGGLFVEEGTYFYIIDAVIEGGEELQKHGFIEVVR